MEGVITEMRITTAKEKAQRRLEVKARSTLMMGISNEHQLKFNSISDAKKLMEAVENRFAVVWRNQADLDTISMDDLYNSLSTNGAVNTAHEVSTASTQVNTAYSRNIDNLSDVVIYAFCAIQPNRMKLTVNGNETINFDKSKVECYNCHKRGHFARECRASRNQDNKNKESSRKSVHVETSTSIALESCDSLDGYDWSDQAEERPNYALMAFSSSSSDTEVSNDSICLKSYFETIELLKSQNDQLLKDLKKSELMVLVPPSNIRNFKPPIPEFSFTGLDEFVNKPVVENCKAMSSKEEPKVVRKYNDAPSTKELVSDDEEEDMSQPNIEKKIVRPINPFRVFNSKTRIVEENLHIRFSESTSNVVGSGTYWLFDIDALKRTINYEPIVAGTQDNGFAGTKASDNAGQARKKTKPVKNYIFLPLWTVDPPFSQDPKSFHDDGSKPSSDDGKKVNEDLRKESECKDQEKEDNVNNTNNINTAGNVNTVSSTINAAGTNEVNDVCGNISIELPFDLKNARFRR
nr:hypothetical protein [Tanacetum cinerariifolium]